MGIGNIVLVKLLQGEAFSLDIGSFTVRKARDEVQLSVYALVITLPNH